MGACASDETRVDAALDSELESELIVGRESGATVEQHGVKKAKAAVVAGIFLAALIAGGLSSVVWGWPLRLDGSGVAGVLMGWSADKPMSGRFEVGEDGKLLRPADAPTPVKPELPAAAREETPEGMEAFSGYVLDTVRYMWLSGDTEPLEELSMPSCSWCKDLIDKQKKRNAKKAWVEDAGHEILANLKPFQIKGHPHMWHMDFLLKSSAVTLYDGDSMQSFPEDEGEMFIQAVYQDGKWMIHEASGRK